MTEPSRTTERSGSGAGSERRGRRFCWGAGPASGSVVSGTEVGGSGNSSSVNDSSFSGWTLGLRSVTGPSLMRRARTRGERGREEERWAFGEPCRIELRDRFRRGEVIPFSPAPEDERGRLEETVGRS